MVVKSYRGLLADGGLDKIRLTTTDGRTGYRIVKLELIPYNPGSQAGENIIGIWKTSAAASVASKYIDFSDSDLLATGYIQNGASNTEEMAITIIFDNEIFNQDIYITSTVADVASAGNNYYIELEQIKLSTAQAEMLIVKSLRGEVWTRP